MCPGNFYICVVHVRCVCITAVYCLMTPESQTLQTFVCIRHSQSLSHCYTDNWYNQMLQTFPLHTWTSGGGRSAEDNKDDGLSWYESGERSLTHWAGLHFISQFRRGSYVLSSMKTSLFSVVILETNWLRLVRGLNHLYCAAWTGLLRPHWQSVHCTLLHPVKLNAGLQTQRLFLVSGNFMNRQRDYTEYPQYVIRRQEDYGSITWVYLILTI